MPNAYWNRSRSLRPDCGPLQLPIGKEKNFSGVVDLVKMKAYTYELGGNGKGKEGEIPANIVRRPRRLMKSWSNWSPKAKTS